MCLECVDFITGRNEVGAKVMFLLQFVILFTGGGVCLSACWDTTPPRADTPQEQTPPRADTPREQTPPGADTPLEQIPPGADTPQIRHPLRTKYTPQD